MFLVINHSWWTFVLPIFREISVEGRIVDIYTKQGNKIKYFNLTTVYHWIGLRLIHLHVGFLSFKLLYMGAMLVEMIK